MKASKSDLIFEARMAFDAGDTRRGSSILHDILKEDITYAPAWKLLHGALNRSDTLAEFQQEFVSKYYPEQADRLRSALEGGADAQGPNGPYRRVSLLSTPQQPREQPPISFVGSGPPDTGPEPAARRIRRPAAAAAEPERDARERPEASRKERKTARGGAPRRGLWGRIRGFFARFRREPRESEPAPGPDRDGLDEVLAGDSGQFAPLSLKDLSRKEAPAASAPPERRRRRQENAPPLLSKLHEEQFEIRLLIADDIPQTRENIRKLLMFEPSVEVVGVAAHGEEAVQLALEHQPDIVLMDINMPGMDGLQALKTIRDALPLTQVIMLTVQDDPGYLREALQFGARDYLIKPPTIDELLQTIQKTHEIGKMERDRFSRLYAQPEEEGAAEEAADVGGFAVAVYSPKGGVGCTLLAANLAVAGQRDDRPVVIVDCDLQYGGIGLFFNEQARSTIIDLAPRIHELDRALLRDAIITHQDSGVRLVLAPNRPEHAERVHGGQIADLIRYLRKVYPMVVVDTGSGLDSTMAEILSAVDQIVLVTTQDIPAINEVRQFMDYAPQIGVSEAKISLVLNQYHKRVNITSEQIGRNLRRELAAVVPLDNRTAIPSINRGVPFMLNPESRALPIGAAVQDLLEHVLERQLVAV